MNCNRKESLEDKALRELLTVLKTQPGFVKVHAAEYLIWLGYTEEPRKEFIKENDLYGDQPQYRIGIWRVLAQAEPDVRDQMMWKNNILEAFAVPDGPDRLHASETLAKLQLSPLEKYPDEAWKALGDDGRNLQLYMLWATCYSSPDRLNENRQRFIHMAATDTVEVARLISSYVLRKIGMNAEQWHGFAKRALAEPSGSAVKFSLITTAFMTKPSTDLQPDLYPVIRKELTNDDQVRSAADWISMAQALAEKGEESDLALLVSLMNNENSSGRYTVDSPEGADVRAAAAYAILKIKQQ